jgi:hypothetical protein
VYWDAKLETLNQAAVQELQLSRLRQTVARAAASPFYGRRLKEAGVAAAKKAGMKCIAVTNTHPRASLKAADLIVDTLEAVSVSDLEMLFSQ